MTPVKINLIYKQNLHFKQAILIFIVGNQLGTRINKSNPLLSLGLCYNLGADLNENFLTAPACYLSVKMTYKSHII